MDEETDEEMYELCYNAREMRMIDDPRVYLDTPADNCPKYKLKLRISYPDSLLLPKVCGNCRWYGPQT